MSEVLVVHAVATWFMTGLIWFVQVVHYPLMASVGAAGFAGYEAAHTRLTSFVVGPVMLAEAATALHLALTPVPAVPATEARVGLALLAVVWLSTALAQVPQHRRLRVGFDPRAHARLVRTNWLRVAGWSGRALLAATWLG